MVPFILQPSTGLPATDGPSTSGPELSQPAADPFESEMNRALARDPGQQEQSSRNPNDSSNGLSQKPAGTGPRPGSTEIQSPTVPGEETSIDLPSKGNTATSRSQHARPRGENKEADSKPASTQDLGLLQALAVTAPVSPISTPPIASALESAGRAKSSVPFLNEADLIGAVKENGVTASDLSTASPHSRVAQSQIAAVSNQQPSQPTPTKALCPAGQGQSAATPLDATLLEAARKGAEAPQTQTGNPGVGDSLQHPALYPNPTGPPNNLTVSGLSAPAPQAGDPADSNAGSVPSTPTAALGKEFQRAVGTSAAQLETSMKKAEKMQKSADLSQQNLPGDGALSAGKLDLSSPASQSVAVAATGVLPASDSRLASLERTHDLVAMHALRVNQSSNEAMRVVIEPGSGTRLSLELRYNNGNVEAQAVLHRGDFDFLSQHWTDLQKRLEPRGVQLGALECSSQSATDQRHSQNSSRQSADETPTRSAFAEFALDGTVTNVPNRSRSSSRTHRGWESWA